MAPPNIGERLAATRWDIPALAELLGVTLHPGQIEFCDAIIQRDHTRWRALWLTLALSAGNRAGKTLLMAIVILHHSIHKMGMRPPGIGATDHEVEVWLKSPYHWYHFGIQQEVGELVFHEITQLLEGTHPAQKGKGCPLVDALGPIASYHTKERGEYRWVVFDRLMGGSEIHFRTTNEKALGSLGKEMNGISFDECGFEQNLTFIVNEVLHLRRLGTGGPLVLMSTPSEGFTQFSDEWKRGDRDDPNAEPDRFSMRMSTRDNVGFGIDRGIFERLIAGVPPELIPQNIDGYFIEGRQAFFNHEAVDRAFDSSFTNEGPRRGKTYVHGIDPALVYDSTWGVVLKVEEGKGTGVYAERKQGKQTLLNVVKMLRDTHAEYNDDGAVCITGLDTTGMGGKVFRDALSGMKGLRSVEFGGTKAKKVKLLTDLKGLLEQGKLRFPREGVWLELRRQLLGYRIDDRKLATDAVMALAVAVKIMLSRPEHSVAAQPFDFFGGADVEDLPMGENAPKKTISALDRTLAMRHAVVTSRMTPP